MASYIGTLKSEKGSKCDVLKAQCDGCQEGPINSYCPDCLQTYCKSCAKAHSNIPTTTRHNLISWDDSSTLVAVLRKTHAQLVEKDKIIKLLEEESARNREEYDKIKAEAEMLKRTQKEQNGDELNNVKVLLAEKEDTIKQLQEEHMVKDKKLQKLTEEMEQAKLADQSNMIADAYEMCMCNEWLEAKQALDDFCIAEEKSNVLLTDILEISYTNCEETVQVAKSRTTHGVNLDAISEKVSEYVQANSTIPSWKTESLRDDDALKKYIEASVRICWRMVLQYPAITLSTDGVNQKWNKRKQDVSYDSDDISDDPRALVMYYAWPTLMQGHRVLVKGSVILK